MYPYIMRVIGGAIEFGNSKGGPLAIDENMGMIYASNYDTYLLRGGPSNDSFGNLYNLWWGSGLGSFHTCTMTSSLL